MAKYYCNNKYIKVKILSPNHDRKVYLFERTQDKKYFICKKIRINNSNNDENQELKQLKQFSHEKYPHLNIIKYVEDFIVKKPSKSYYHLFIITEHYEGGDLSNLKEIEFFNITYLLLKMTIILKELETPNVYHRDIKPANIFYVNLGKNTFNDKDEYEFYLGDFGSSKAFNLTIQEKGTLIGTKDYLAPEVWKLGGYSNKVDIYSLGKTLLEILKYNSNFIYNNIYIELFNRMIDEEPNNRPSPSQILEFLCRIDKILRLSSIDQCHRNFKSTILFVNEKYKLSTVKKINFNFNFNFKINDNPLVFNELDNFDLDQNYNCISSVERANNKEFYIEKDNKYYSAHIIKNIWNPTELKSYFELLKKDEIISSYFSSESKVLHFNYQNKIESVLKGYEEDGKNYFILINPLENNFKQVCISNPNAITREIQLKILFKLLVLFFRVIECGNEKIVCFYFSNINALHVCLIQYDESTKEYQDISFSHVPALNSTFDDRYNFLDSLFRIYNIQVKDPIIDQLYDNFEVFKDIKIPIHYSFKSIYEIVSKEKERLVKENHFLLEYYDHLEKSFANISAKLSNEINSYVYSTLKPLCTIRQYHSKSDKILKLNVSKEGDDKYLGISVFFGVQSFLTVANILNEHLEKVKVNDILLIHSSTKLENNNYFLFYNLPSSLIKCYHESEEFEIKRSKYSIKQKDEYFWRLANKHINNLQVIKSDYLYPFLYCLETIIVNEELFYIYDYIAKCPFNIIGSVYDIGLYVYGNNSVGSCQQLLTLDFFRYLSHIFSFSVTVQKGHLKIDYSLSDSAYYLHKLFSPFLDSSQSSISPSQPSYSKIQIGEIKYNILDFLVLNLVKNKFLTFDYSLVTMVLEDSISNNKYYCIRKQLKKEVEVILNNEIEYIQNKNEHGNQFNDDIISPDYVIQDCHTSYHFFKFNGQFPVIKTIEDIKEKDYNEIGIIRSLLYFIEYLVSNPVDSNLNIFIKSSSIQSKQLNNEPFFLFFDISYFLNVVYGLKLECIEWNKLLDSFYSGKSIISNFLQTNQVKVLEDKQICGPLIERINKIKNIINIYDISIAATIKDNVEKVKLNGKHYIRKITGFLNQIKESIEVGTQWSLLFKDSKSKIKSLPLDQLKLYLEIFYVDDIDPFLLNYQFNSEFRVLNTIKGTPGVVQISDFYISNDIIYILIEFCEKSNNLTTRSIFKDKNQKEKNSILILVLKQMVDILVNLEKFDIYHRDIKNENILIIDENGQIKCLLSDFGISGFGYELKLSEDIYYFNLGTKGYQAPELFNKECRSKNELKSLSNKMDIYSLGCVIFNLISEFNIEVDESLTSILSEMTENNYDKRIDLLKLAQLVNNL